MRRTPRILPVLVAVMATACVPTTTGSSSSSSSSGGNGTSNAGTSNAGSGGNSSGVSTTGSSAGGNSSAGNSSAGNSSGGNSSGGISSGGNSSGGISSGGNSSGGNSSGGNSSGGNSSGGNSSGGNSSGGNSSTGSGGNSSSGGSSQAEQEFRQIFAAQCAYEERCATEVGRTYSTPAACVAYFETLLPLFAAQLTGVSFNVTHRQACLDAFYGANVSCVDPPTFPAPCSDYYVLENPLAVGASCGDDNELCDPSLSCSSDAAGCARCTALAAVGQACSNTQPCAGRAACISNICTLPAARGQPCGNTPCAGGLTCSGAPGVAPTCTDRVGLNENCDNVSCFQDLQCATGPASRVCVARSADGSVCGRSDATGCVGGACRFETPTAPMGQCSTFDYSTTIGGPCLTFGSFPYCESGRPQTEGTPGEPPTACTCVDYTPAGQACLDFQECALECVGLNPTTTPPTPGTCSAPAADGAGCNRDAGCISGFCANGTCGAPPVCQ